MAKLYRASYRHLISGQYLDSESMFESDEEAKTDAYAKSQFPYVLSRLSIVDYNTVPPTVLDVKLNANALPDITITERDIPNPNCPAPKGKK